MWVNEVVNPPVRQAEINRLLVSHAMEGKMVVRLKGVIRFFRQRSEEMNI